MGRGEQRRDLNIRTTRGGISHISQTLLEKENRQILRKEQDIQAYSPEKFEGARSLPFGGGGLPSKSGPNYLPKNVDPKSLVTTMAMCQ